MCFGSKGYVAGHLASWLRRMRRRRTDGDCGGGGEQCRR